MIKRDDDILVLKAVLLYIITNSQPSHHDVYSIVKTAFCAQQLKFAKYGTPLFSDSICALPWGPVPSDAYNILKMARGDERELNFHKNDNFHLASDAIGFENELFFAKEQPDLDYLSASDIEILNEAIMIISKKSFNEIVRDTHSPEWNRAFHCETSKVMNNLSIAKEGGADDSILSYLKEFLDLNCVLG